jgi:hypothetical protein
MAKHVIAESYSFEPSTRTVTINGKAIRRESLVLILNVTTNTVIYNFADSALTASSYTVSTTNNVETTTIQLAYNTTSMLAGHKLSIIVDEVNETFIPAEQYMDPVSKFRTSTPQALIDTDFEYGTQPTKWETLALLTNRPSAFYDATAPILPITSMTPTGSGSRIVTVATTYVAAANPFTTSIPVFIQDSTNPDANGWVLPLTVTGASGSYGFTYLASAGITPTTNIFDATKTYIFVGSFFTSAAIPVSASAGLAFVASGTTVTATTTYNHGLTVGDAIFVVGTTAVTSGPPNGAWQVLTTPTSNTFTFQVVTAPSGAITATAGANATLYVRSYGSSIHRPFDGGVNFSAGTPYHGNQLIRQTRRQFRYQSGIGMQITTVSNLCPLFQVDTLTASGATVTATFKFPHNLGVGATITVSGATESAYNGTFTIVSIPTATTLTYTALSSPSATPASGWPINIGPKNWYGASVRVGMFDSQNGFFFEYDGQTLYACQRRSTDQLSGYISALTSGTPTCTGVGTKWSQQLIPGDVVVIRGMTYFIQSIISDTSMNIYPEYRGTSIAAPTQCFISKTITVRTPQSSWNIDKMDGTGTSQYNVDITKMQMWYIDYSWYGAGAIRFGFKDQRGEVKFAHRIANANVETEAYMRSGNLPARYESNTFAPYTVLNAALNSGDTSMTVASTTGFPSTGTLCVTASANTGAVIEYMNYTGKTGTTFTGLTRGITNLTGPGGLTGMGGAAATTFSLTGATAQYPAGTAPAQVSLYSPQTAVTIGHWGSSVIMDGQFDDDKSFLFNYGMNAPVVYANLSQAYPVFSIRLAPSVDGGTTGLLGARELINRMQLTPEGLGVYTTTAGVRVELRLNARVSAGTWGAVGGSSLAQFALHTNVTTVAGGESIFTFIAPAGGVTSADLSRVRDIGNSILGGGTTLSITSTDLGKYPDGPDTITVVVYPLAASASVTARLSWTEAQA